MTTNSFTLPRFVSERLAQKSALRNVGLVVVASLFIAISAQVSIPLMPVPMTLQPVAILLVGAALGSSRGASAAALYLLEGFSGMPVFAGMIGATLIGIFIIPMLYVTFQGLREATSRRFGRPSPPAGTR